ncbi:hypothetical protein CKO09_09970 [Chromatium weissei]|nr:hypothetical protein [Chromatium weissei]
MSDTHFDLYFDGTLTAGTDSALVRQQLAALFKLDAAGVARLFTGQPILVRANADAATAAKFELAFARIGAVLTMTPIAAVAEVNDAPAPVAPAVTEKAVDRANSRFIDAPEVLEVLPQAGFIEQEPVVKMTAFDTSGFSLVTETNWSLEDCQIPITPAPIADLSHLSLAAIDSTSTRKDHEL